MSAETLKSLEQLVGVKKSGEIVAMYESRDPEASVMIDAETLSKEERSRVHAFISNHFKLLNSQTVSDSLIKVTVSPKRQKSKPTKKQRYEALPQYLSVVAEFEGPGSTK